MIAYLVYKNKPTFGFQVKGFAIYAYGVKTRSAATILAYDLTDDLHLISYCL